MKEKYHQGRIPYRQLTVWLLAIFLFGCGGSKSDSKAIEQPIAEPTLSTEISITIDAAETGSAIYVNGDFSGQVTPAELLLAPGEYNIGVGLAQSRQYLKTSVTLISGSEPLTLALNAVHQQQAKVWQALFIGVNQVRSPNGNCISEYSQQELDAGFDFFTWSFNQRVEGYSYNTMQWQFDRRDISHEVVTLSDENLITPDIIDGYLNDVHKGDYDLIVTFFRGGAGNSESCYIDDFKGIAWYDYRVLNADASYFTIRYYDDVQGTIDASKKGDTDPGMYIHEWLHTTAEWFFPDRGYTMPKQDDQVVHAAGAYNYSPPWMEWYKDLIAGQVKQGDKYIGIGPEAFLACSVRESALGACESVATDTSQ
ncbi:hypothetical protein tinsulaeT_03190 [Thalassotalea insulae]|uniref:PEGA domain-containing protein n=1 Tax=Thalassotalea insulae TaxID=2056778 RepID=A0ABQ6GN33_9GAMM|nr:hypothetical protein [Thalassotalea insulae]GLX76979.1 hypothetical protein tinsulaeT_03190 [Thalassotalea insulae]